MAICAQAMSAFCIGAVGYCALEILWRGYTHPSMALVGGFCFIVILTVDALMIGQPRLARAAVCAVGVSAVELASGLVINVALKLDVWDYSHLPLNFMGQICPLYSAIWFVLCYFLLLLLDRCADPQQSFQLF